MYHPQNDDITFVAVKEKLMQGEVLFTIQKELFSLIDEKKLMVKEACEKMQVSPYMYRKYKKIKDSVGLEGLKELLYDSDYIEKKHLSIEVKTKLYDVISNHPEYGPKKISEELNTEKYSYTDLDGRRIYNELVRAKLNTKEKRENYIKRGGKKRIKLPGTPLLTLDGQVILDYESAEKVISDRTGVKTPDEIKPAVPEIPRTTIERQISTARDEEKEIEAKEEEPVVEEEVKEEEEVKAEEVEPTVEEKTEAEIEKTEPEERVEEEAGAKTPEPEVEEETIEKEEAAKDDEKIIIDVDALERAMKEVKEKKPEKGKVKKSDKIPAISAEEIVQLKAEKDAVLKEMGGKKRREKPRSETEEKKVPPIPSFEFPEQKISEKRINHFYTIISDDIQKISSIVDSWRNGKVQKKDLLKIGTILGMISTNSLLKSLGRVEQIFVQVIRYFEFLETHDGELNTKMIRQNSKDMLKYIEKENILSNSDKILEQINELGIKNHQFRIKLTGKKPGKESQLDAIRKKIAKKNMIKNEKILNNISKTNNR
jgi:hypothetical protein